MRFGFVLVVIIVLLYGCIIYDYRSLIVDVTFLLFNLWYYYLMLDCDICYVLVVHLVWLFIYVWILVVLGGFI